MTQIVCTAIAAVVSPVLLRLLEYFFQGTGGAPEAGGGIA
jgi:hypothetical protein